MYICRGRFCDKGQKCENSPNLPLGSLEVFVYEKSSPKFTMYKKQRLMVLWQERIKMLTTKVQKKYKNITGLKFRPTVTQKRKLREAVRKRGKAPLYPYFHPQVSELWECFPVQWILALKFQLYGENVFQQVWNFDPQSHRRGNWGKSWQREGRFPYTHISTPKV